MIDDELVECAACGNHVDGLTTVQGMYDVCSSCLENYEMSAEDGS